MDILNNSIVTDADTEVLDSQITQISNDFSETYYFDSEQEEELELLVAKAMKLGELYERKKWQAAKAQAVPEGFVLVSAEQMSQWGHMANYAEQYGCPECFEARGYAHNLGCEINAYFNVSEAQEQK